MMTDAVSRDDVLEYIAENEPISIADVKNGLAPFCECPTCGVSHDDAELRQRRHQIECHVRSLVNNNEISSTPEWEYRLSSFKREAMDG